MNSIGLDISVSKKVEVLASEIDNEIVLYTLDQGVYFAINETGRLIWDALDEHPTIRTVTHYLCETYELNSEIVSDDVSTFIKTLLDKKLVFRSETPT